MELKYRSKASSWGGKWFKELARKKMSQWGGIGKKLLVTFGKHYSPYPTWFQKLPITLLPPNTYSKIHDQPFSPSKSTERMRPPAFPTVETSAIVLHFLILLLNHSADARGYVFCLYFELLFKNSLIKKNPKTPKKWTILMQKTSPTSLQNTSGQRLKTQVNQVSL